MRHFIDIEIRRIAKENQLSENSLRVKWLLFWRLLDLAARFLLSRYYLRKVNKLGKYVFTKWKPDIDNQGFMQIDNTVKIWSRINRCRLAVKKGASLYVGANTLLNGPIIAATCEVRIGKNCLLAPQVQIMDSDFHGLENHDAKGDSKPIIIEDNVWLATRSMVLKGVRIGKGAVVAAGAIVTKDVAPYTVVAGIPARVIKTLPIDHSF